MVAAIRRVHLSGRQLAFLKANESLVGKFPKSLQEILAETENGTVFEVSGDDAESIRSALTLYLAEFGFDAEYEPTKEGQILEDLIDRFHQK